MLSQISISKVPAEAWTLGAAVVGFLAWLGKKLLFRKTKPKPEYITRAEFHAGLDTTRDRITASYMAVAEKVDANHKELLAAVTDLAQKTELRLDHHEATLARLDERTTELTTMPPAAAPSTPPNPGAPTTTDPAPDPLQEPDPDEQADQTQSKRRRNGHVARLPEKVRNEINQLLLDGVSYPDIPTRIGPAAEGIKPRHIQNWYAGGYKDWLDNRDRQDALSWSKESALALLEVKAGAPIQEAGRTIAATQIFELLKSFHPAAFADSLVDKPELYLRMINTLARLSEGEAACAHRRLQELLLTSKQTLAETTQQKLPPTSDNLHDASQRINLL